LEEDFMDLILIGGLGLPELGVILLIVIVIFGASRLPQLGKGLGEGIRNFKSSLRDGDRSSEKKNDEAES
jgi:sec-independent protein translocase protein TatA